MELLALLVCIVQFTAYQGNGKSPYDVCKKIAHTIKQVYIAS